MRLNRKIVLEGAGATGKSTLGRLLADALDTDFHPSTTRPVHARHGTRPGYLGTSPGTKALVQRDMMAAATRSVDHGPNPGIYDRGAPSVYAYSLLELSREESPLAWNTLDDAVRAVHRAAIDSRDEETFYLLLPTNIPFEHDGFRQDFPWLREHVQNLIRGILNDFRFKHMSLGGIELKERLVETIKVLGYFGMLGSYNMDQVHDFALERAAHALERHQQARETPA